MHDLWHTLPTGAQDGLIALVLLTMPTVLALILARGFAPLPLITASLRRDKGLSLAFVMLVAVSVALGAGITAQERGLREGSAAAADGFDIVVTAPGNEVTSLMATVFLQPSAVPLLTGEVFAELHDHPRIALAAPLAFGDSYAGAPVVGTTAAFVEHLARGPATGEMWTGTDHALAGAETDMRVGDTFFPAHGIGSDADPEAHGHEITVVGVLPRTGTPWDAAILVPVESVWETHGLATGHAEPGRLGPPYDPALFPGTPAVIVQPDSIASAFGLRNEFNLRADTMAFFPGEVLSRLYVIMGDIRQAMSVLSTVTQLLVAGAVLLALAILARLNRRRMAMLRALGAPDRFVMAVTWGHATVILALGTGLGLLLGLGAAAVLSQVISARTGLTVPARLGWQELHLALGFLALACLVALIPAWRATQAAITPSLRA